MGCSTTVTPLRPSGLDGSLGLHGARPQGLLRWTGDGHRGSARGVGGPGRRGSRREPLRRFLHGLPGVDQVGAEARAASLATRSIKKTAKAWAIDTAIGMVDLTTLEGADTPGKVRSLCAKAVRPDPSDPSCPAGRRGLRLPGPRRDRGRRRRRVSPVQVASVATAFPSGRAALATKLHDVRDAVAAGATEIDMVIDRGAFLVRALRPGVRRDRGDEGGLRRRRTSR